MLGFDEKLIKLFKKDTKFVSEDGRSLNRNEIINSALRIDKDLIDILIEDDEIRSYFFDKIEKYYIFNINKFVEYVEDKNVWGDSYTKFKNQIGLTIDGKYLRERGEVSLVWPFKDCVLEGGMTKEDQKRNEIFFNEILAKDEIDRLFDPKVLTNFKKFTAKGEEKVEDFNRDEKGTIKDNLIIKGNNLLALHSLRKEFAGKVKLIYIDPPYNTGNDGFKYNDNFNRSTWMTFMKNRLEIAKEFLTDDGVIFVQIDYNNAHYLKILMDEIFGELNFKNEIIWKRKSGVASRSNMGNSHDTIFYYGKTQNSKYIPIFLDYSEDYIKKQFKKDKEGRLYRTHDIVASPSLGGNSPRYEYKGFIPKTRWLVKKEKLVELDRKGLIGWTKNGFPYRILYLDELTGQPLCDVWTDINNAAGKEKVFFVGQKPEALIERILKISTVPKDLILDFQLGTGTTCAVAHKMNRRYIGIEQMDYGQISAEERLKRVIEGDDSGISKKVKWQGGGEFIYCELKKYNEEALDKIQEAKDTKSLLKIWDEMVKYYFLNYDVEIDQFNKNKDNFEKLSLQNQKKLLCEMLNKNQLYVNLSEIDDKQFGIGKEDKELNLKFYKI